MPPLEGEPLLLQPKCLAIKCPLHKEAAPRESITASVAQRPRRLVVVQEIVGSTPTARPKPRRSKLEVANQRNLKLLASRPVKTLEEVTEGENTVMSG